LQHAVLAPVPVKCRAVNALILLKNTLYNMNKFEAKYKELSRLKYLTKL
jgi:hypothetical protein